MPTIYQIADKLIKKEDITEEMKLIEGSETDYITPTGKVYKDYGNGLFYPKKNFINKKGYIQTNITYPFNKSKTKNIHVLIAKAFIPNPNNYPVVMHLDNNKQNHAIKNLKWGTYSENNQQAHNDKLIINKKGFDDSQSKTVVMYDIYTRKPLGIYGSCGECAKITKIPLATILSQCRIYKNKKHSKCSRIDVYFRYLEDGNINPPPIVIQYDYETDKEIDRYYNTFEAQRQTKIPYRTISGYCEKGIKPNYKPKSGYYFMYG